MKNIHIVFACALALTFSFSSCKKKDDDPKPLKSFSFPSGTDLVVELAWNVNGQTPGYDHADVDLFIDDEVTSPSYAIDYYSSSSTAYESITIDNADPNKTLYVGVKYFAQKGSSLTSPYKINYTITVYPSGNAGSSQSYSGTITNGADTDVIYDQLKLVKSASGYAFTELSPKTTFTQP